MNDETDDDPAPAPCAICGAEHPGHVSPQDLPLCRCCDAVEQDWHPAAVAFRVRSLRDAGDEDGADALVTIAGWLAAYAGAPLRPELP